MKKIVSLMALLALVAFSAPMALAADFDILNTPTTPAENAAKYSQGRSVAHGSAQDPWAATTADEMAQNYGKATSVRGSKPFGPYTVLSQDDMTRLYNGEKPVGSAF
jgi:hypothetical protein